MQIFNPTASSNTTETSNGCQMMSYSHVKSNACTFELKGTLMQIWKSPYMFVSNKNNTLKISHS